MLYLETCMSIRETDLNKFFEKEEIDRVLIDVAFMQRKKNKRIENIYKMAEGLILMFHKFIEIFSQKYLILSLQKCLPWSQLIQVFNALT